jgi:hypothetical protein
MRLKRVSKSTARRKRTNEIARAVSRERLAEKRKLKSRDKKAKSRKQNNKIRPIEGAVLITNQTPPKTQPKTTKIFIGKRIL